MSARPEAALPAVVPSRWQPAFDGPGLVEPRLPFVPRVKPNDPRIVRLRDSLMETDGIADALAAWIAATPSGRASFERAVTHGIDAVPSAPEPLAAFFRDVDVEPPWLDREQCRLGAETMCRVGAGGYAALGSVSLMSGYLASGAVKPLAMTGALTRMARRRLAETSRFVLDVSTSGDFGRHSPGFHAALRVRLLHATICRSLQRSPDWRTEAWGLPINQHDMVATNLQFSSVYVVGLLAQGYLVSRREREAVMHLWRWVGHVSGVRDDLLPRTFREGLQINWIINHTEAGPDDDSRALAGALAEATRALHAEGLGPRLGAFRSRVELGLSRWVLGDRAADALGVPDDVFKWAPLVFAPPTIAAELVRRAVPGARRFQIRFATRIVRDALDRALDGKPPPFAVAPA